MNGTNQVVVVDGEATPPVALAPYTLDVPPPPANPNINTYDAVVAPDQTRMYVVNDLALGDLSVQMVDLLTGQVSRVSLGGFSNINRGQFLTMSPDGNRVYVLASGKISVIDSDPASGAYNTVIARFGSGFNVLAVSGDNRYLYAGQFTNPRRIDIWDLSLMPAACFVAPSGCSTGVFPAVTQLPNPALHATQNVTAIEFSLDGTKAYVATGRLHVIDTASQAYVATFLPLTPQTGGTGVPLPVALDITDDGAFLYAASADKNRAVLSVIDTATDTEVAVVSGGMTGMIDVAVAGNRAYSVSVFNLANVTYVIDTDAVAAAVASGAPLPVQVAARLATLPNPSRTNHIAAVNLVNPDLDGDGVLNEDDLCPGTLAGAAVNFFGCTFDQLQGPQGSAGLNGLDGATGPQGEQGKLGPPGPPGPTGPAGANGTDGTSGTDGADGATGPSGLQGEQGKLGPQGEQGPQGEGLFAGSLLMLPAGSPAPEGYSFLGTFELLPDKPRGGGNSAKSSNKSGKGRGNGRIKVDVYVRD